MCCQMNFINLEKLTVYYLLNCSFSISIHKCAEVASATNLFSNDFLEKENSGKVTAYLCNEHRSS